MATEFDITKHKLGDQVTLDDWSGPSCDVCDWAEGFGFVAEGQYDPEEKRYRRIVLCDVCQSTDAGRLAQWDVFMVHDRGVEYALLKAMSQHTNLILREIRDARSSQ